MKRIILISLIVLVFGCGDKSLELTDGIKNGDIQVHIYPESKLIKTNDTEEYKQYTYHTKHEFDEILAYYSDAYGEPVESNYDEHEVIQHTYESSGKKIVVKMSYLDNDMTEIDIKQYN